VPAASPGSSAARSPVVVVVAAGRVVTVWMRGAGWKAYATASRLRIHAKRLAGVFVQGGAVCGRRKAADGAGSFNAARNAAA
jgi:hypothetical protein